MPKVSEYELEHYTDENYSVEKFRKKSKPVKEKKYSDKKDKRAEWRKRAKYEDSLQELSDKD